MKEIILTQGKIAIVDDCDFERLNQFKWYARKSGKIFYAGRMAPYINGKRYLIHMHHEVIGTPPKGLMPDHINGMGTDNGRENLRFVTNRQNQQNQQNVTTSSKYPGVSWSKSRKKWEVRSTINKKHKFLGFFTDEETAFKAYKQALSDIGETIVGEI